MDANVVADQASHERGRKHPATVPQPLHDAAAAGAAALLDSLHTGEAGLTEEDAAARLRQTGPNDVLPVRRTHLALDIARRLLSPLSLMLLVLSGISLAIGEFSSAGITASMVLLSVGLATWQERRSVAAATALRALVHNTATVQRRADAHAAPTHREIPLAELVPGDIVHIGAGDIVPADLRLLFTKDLFLNQSAMTGESVPVEKHAGDAPGTPPALLPGDLRNVALMGTTVLSGTGSAVVVLTGPHTVLGTISRLATQTAPPTAFETGIRRVANLMLTLIGVMTPLVFLINYLTKDDPFEALLFALAVAVGLTPELLPMLTTVTLSKGALAMARRKVIVKQLAAIQQLGAMDVLCTDKTGTLTQDSVILHRHVDIAGKESERVFALTYLNSHFQTGLRNLLDTAVLHHDEAATRAARLDEGYRLVDEIPFDFERRRMSVIVQSEAGHLLVCKGAVEEVLAACETCECDGAVAPLTPARRRDAMALARRFNHEGFRLLAVAFRQHAAPRAAHGEANGDANGGGPHGTMAEGTATPHSATYGVADEQALTLAGFVAFIDPPKESAAGALRAIRASGIAVKVLTGDSPEIARHVCRLVGIDAGEIVLGRQLEGMDLPAMGELADAATVFAKLTPEHKAALVRALRARGHVVGVLGDGINDSPALHAADVGISVDTGTDIARETADVILLEKSLLVLHEGVIEGRRVFANLIKYIRMAASSNFGNVFSVLGASLWLPFLPMAPIQLLTCNLLYDLSQTSIPTDRVDDDALAQPSNWDIRVLWRYIAVMGPLSSCFDYLTFALLYGLLHLNTPAQAGAFQSAWFVESILSQMLVIYIIRTRRLPFIESQPSATVVATTIALAAVAMWLPFSPLAQALQLVPPVPAFWLYLPGILVLYLTGAFLVRGWLHPPVAAPVPPPPDRPAAKPKRLRHIKGPVARRPRVE